MPEMKNSFQRGKMNKDLDERILPQGEYTDALNVEVNTSEGSNIGTLQTIKGNSFLEGQGWENGVCIGSIADDKNDKLYFMIAGVNYDLIVEYFPSNFAQPFAPVCVDAHLGGNIRALNFNKNFLITGVNIIDDIICWTDNNSEPKKINITRGKEGSQVAGIVDYFTSTRVVMKNPANLSVYVDSLDEDGLKIPIQERHLTIIKQGPPAAPVLEMVDTEQLDVDGDGDIGGYEVRRLMTLVSPNWTDAAGDFLPTLDIDVGVDVDGDGTGADFNVGDAITVYAVEDPSVKVRLIITAFAPPTGYTCTFIAGDQDIKSFSEYIVELVQPGAMFEFKLPRFACRYKYADGEYSAFSPFTETAFLPGTYNYMPKEGYNLAMVNRVRKLAIKNFVHTRLLPEDVVAIDILYKESNSTSIYSVKTIKNRAYNASKWDEWNAISGSKVIPNPSQTVNSIGWYNRSKGYLPITSEMIHAVLPANQLLRPWDNVPRKALAQEVVGSRLVYGNYLQNYDLSNNDTNEDNLKVDINARLKSWEIGDIIPEEIRALDGGFWGNGKGYNPAKSLKTLRTYQLGVIYIDKYGRETPIFSEDKIGTAVQTNEASSASLYNKKENAALRNTLVGTLLNNPPDWATHWKYFVKETSNEYYNLAMDRFYDAEDGNIWLSFPSSERNKVDEETFITLKKEHDSNVAVPEKASYKILAISNEAPRFIKMVKNIIGTIQDDGTVLGHAGAGFPLVGETAITIGQTEFDNAGLDKSLMEDGVSSTLLRVTTPTAVSNYYRIKSVAKDSGFYRVRLKEEFKEDMSITSADGTLATRITTCAVDIVRRVEENKAEFDGRFFAKILRDAVLVARLGISLAATVKFKRSSSMKVQYIDPRNPNQAGINGRFFSKDPMRLSTDEKNKDIWSAPAEFGGWLSTNSSGGDGRAYWKMAGDVENEPLSASSGWFIDKVEGYRPFKGHFETGDGSGPVGHNSKPNNYQWEVFNSGNWAWNATTGADYNARLPKNMVNVAGLNAYGDSGTNYLGPTIMRPPANLITPNAGKDVISDPTGAVSRTVGGQIAKPVGIDPASNTINLSYSGLNGDAGGTGNYASGGSLTLLKSTNGGIYFDQTAFTLHVEDVAFITKLTAPGTLWQWKEDPGQVIYQTIAPIGLTPTSIPHTQDQWNAETKDYFDLEPGVFLFNYANHADYLRDAHHNAQLTYGCFPLANQVNDTNHNDWITRDFGDHQNPCLLTTCAACALYGLGLWQLIASVLDHPSYPGARQWGNTSGFAGNFGGHHTFANGIHDWGIDVNKRRRFSFQAQTAGVRGQTAGDPLGSVGPHHYLPTNDCTLPPHWGYDSAGDFVALTDDPITGSPWVAGEIAPGIRPDGMYSGHIDPDGMDTWQAPSGVINEPNIPNFKRWDVTNVNYTHIPGSCTWEILEAFVEDTDGSAMYSSTNPAIWETEPKEDVGLDIYHEIGQIYPIHLDANTIEQFVGAIGEDVSRNSWVQCWDPPYVSVPGATASNAAIPLTTGNTNVRVSAAEGRFVQLSSVDNVVLDSTIGGHAIPLLGSVLIFHRADGGTTEAHVLTIQQLGGPGGGDWFELSGNITNGDVGVHNKMVTLPWFNCYSYGNGVESDRIRDDFNQITIDNGPKVSTTIEGQYREDRRENGFIWSGIYNSTSGVNNLNQFIQAEAITKDVNPGYGSIQKMSVRDSDLVAFCEDRVLKVLADKDALFNADGNTNLVATNRVLGSIRPFVGDYGISKNPESFAQDSYRSYFSDTSRGVVVRLSQDGLTPISDAGMKDWFADNLPSYASSETKIIGSFDDKKQEYNITLNGSTWGNSNLRQEDFTISYSEPTKGWVSFKSFIQENGVSLNNSYYTLKASQLYEHHTNETRNNFYGSTFSDPLTQFDSSVDVLFNQNASMIKSFSTLNYEGSQSRVTQDTINNPDYYDDVAKEGWYISNMTSKQIIDSLQDGQELGEMEFWDKEDKWFSQIKGVTTKWLDDGTAGNIDPREFSYQGIGNAFGVTCPTCPPVNPGYNCSPGSPQINMIPAVLPVLGSSLIPGYYTGATSTIPGYYVGATLGTPGYYVPTSSNCNAAGLVFDNSGSAPFTNSGDWKLNITGSVGNPPAVPLTLDLSSVYHDISSANPIWSPGSVPDSMLWGYDTDGTTWINNTGAIPSNPLHPSNFCTGSTPGTYSAFHQGFDPLAGTSMHFPPSQQLEPNVGDSKIYIIQTEFPSYYWNTAQNGSTGSTGGIHPAANPGGLGCKGLWTNTSNQPAVFLKTPPGFNSAGYKTYGDLLADVSAIYPTASPGNPYTTPISLLGAEIVRYLEWEFFLTQGANPTLESKYEICAPRPRPCMCTNVWVPPVLPTLGTWVPPVAGNTGTWVPPVPAVTAVAGSAMVPMVPAVLPGCVPAVGGTYSTLAACNAVCNIAPSWNCLQSVNTANGLITNYCADPGTGLGTYSTLAACNTNCTNQAILPTWECINGNCNQNFIGSGNFTTLASCTAVCGVVTTPVSWNCDPMFPGNCTDPGNGLGTYTDANSGGSPGDGLIACNSACNHVIIGSCNVNNATTWNLTASFLPGQVVLYSGFYYINNNIYTIVAGAATPLDPFGPWDPCVAPTTVGACTCGPQCEEFDSYRQDETIAMPDGTFGYDKDDVVSTTWWNGNITYYYSTYDIDPTNTMYPGGPVFSSFPLPFGTVNPWADCNGTGLTTFGSYDPLGTQAPCDVSNYAIWDPTADYQVGVFDNSPNLDGNWAVLHNGVFWVLGVLQITPSLWDWIEGGAFGCDGQQWIVPNPWGYGDATSGSTLVGCDGTVSDKTLPFDTGQFPNINYSIANPGSGMLMDNIDESLQSYLFGQSGVQLSTAGIEPGSLLSPWIPCSPAPITITASSGCCDSSLTVQDNFATYGYQAMACINDNSCLCVPSMCQP